MKPRNTRNTRNLIALTGLICLASSCARTVAPKVVVGTQASWDGGEQNSGIMAETEEHAGVVTPHFRDRYNALVEVYGGKFQPPLSRDAGVQATGTNTFLIDAQHFEYFFIMNRWRRSAATGHP
jgi:hypothetical protein